MNDSIPLDDSLPEPAPEGPNTPSYPQVTLSNPDLENFPDQGKAVIEHEVIRRTHEKLPKGKHSHRITLSIKSIRAMGRKKNNFKTRKSEGAMRDLVDNVSQ